jgi:hypothetical protein
MILGMSVSAFVPLHVIISLIGIATGLVVLVGLLGARAMPAMTAIFLLTTIATSVTGFMFPFSGLTPAMITGFVSLAVLAVAVFACYGRRMAGSWRPIYVIAAVASLYLNTFVLVVQSFQKLPFLQPLAPTQTEPPFLVAQAVTLLAFVVLGFIAVRRFRKPVQVFA